MFNLRPPGQKPLLGTPIDWSNPLSQGLVGAWIVNEGAGDRVFDTSGFGNNGTLVGDVFWKQQTLSFDGTGDRISLGSNVFALGSQNRTLIVRIKPSSVTGNNYIFSLGADNAGERWSVLLNDNKLRIEIQASGHTGSTSIINNAWVTVACVLNGTTLGNHILYVGNISENANGAGAVNTVSTYANIAEATDDHAQFGTVSFEGLIDYGYIYNRALSSNEIQSHHADPYQMWPDYALWLASSPVIGWTHKWNTIAAANIGKINTVPKANIAKINTV